MTAVTLQSINTMPQQISAPKFTSKSAEIFYKVDKDNLSDPQLRSSMDTLCSRVSNLEVLPQQQERRDIAYYMFGAALIIMGLALAALCLGLTLGTGGFSLAFLAQPILGGALIIFGIAQLTMPFFIQSNKESLQEEINSSVKEHALNTYLVNHSEDLKEKLQNAISLKQTDLESRVMDDTLEIEIAQLQKAVTDLETLVQLAKAQDLKVI